MIAVKDIIRHEVRKLIEKTIKLGCAQFERFMCSLAALDFIEIFIPQRAVRAREYYKRIRVRNIAIRYF